MAPGSRPRTQTPGLAFAQIAEARQPFGPHTGLRVVYITKLQRSHTATARHLARPAPDGTFTTELSCAGSLPTQVGHDYRSIRFTPDRTFTGCSVSLVGCTLFFFYTASAVANDDPPSPQRLPPSLQKLRRTGWRTDESSNMLPICYFLCYRLSR